MCGIVGYFSEIENNVIEKAINVLYSEQHRGQEGAGIVVSNGDYLKSYKKMGYVKEIFTKKIIEELKGNIAIGHVRYSTRGSSEPINLQPHLIQTLGGFYAVANNGDIRNYNELKKELSDKGVYFATKNEGEVLGKFIVYYHEREGLSIIDAIKLLMKKVKGAFSAVFLTKKSLYVFRDIYGFRPLLTGKVENDIVFASESCALDILKAENIKEIEPGEIVVVNKNGIETYKENTFSLNHCIFELIYFARPDSHQFDEYVYDVRQKIGAKLSTYDNFKADAVIPVPDSANYIALGYARGKNIFFDMGLIRNHYVGRTFIKPNQSERNESVNQKFNPLKDYFKDKEIIVVDDSIVRGTTMRKLIKMIRKAGAKKIHLRIGSPPIKGPCYYGIDTPTEEELIANNMSLEEIKEFFQVDSLKYLKIEDLRDCVKLPNDYCYACFNKNYPV